MAFPNAVVNGTPVNFTFQSVTGITITEIPGTLLQSANYKKVTTRKLVMDGNGNRTTSGHIDPILPVELKWIISGSGFANAITNTVLQQPGNFVTITGCPSMPELISANRYEVLTGELSGTMDGFKEVSMTMEQAANITGPAAA